jgi:CubicO group peptidase (beta-lactamase class C family)
MQRDQLFRLASVSKPLLTTVILRLVAEGVLDLDAPVQRWLPDFRPALADGSTPPISLRQLLSHSSGLGYRFLEADATARMRAGVSDGMDANPLSLADNVRRIAQAPLLFAPGSQWLYSLGVDVAGAVAEAATGETLQALFERLLAAPLGLRDTASLRATRHAGHALCERHAAAASPAGRRGGRSVRGYGRHRIQPRARHRCQPFLGRGRPGRYRR